MRLGRYGIAAVFGLPPHFLCAIIRGLAVESLNLVSPLQKSAKTKALSQPLSPPLSDWPFFDKGCDEGRDEGSQPSRLQHPLVNAARHILLWVGLLWPWCAGAAAPGGDWPMFRGGPALTGVAAGQLPDRLVLLWTFKTAGPVKSSPAIAQDRVFIGSDDGHLYALTLAEGNKVWAFKTGGGVESSPLVLDGKVFVGSSDAFLYALEAGTGKLAWKYETGDKILGAPNWSKSGDGSGAGVSPAAPGVSPALPGPRARRPPHYLSSCKS